MLHALGLMPHGNQHLVPYVMQLFEAIRKEKTQGGKSKYRKLCDDFRWTFARRIAEGDDDRHFRVHFVGIWDTVSSVGWVWDSVNFQYTAHNPSIDIIRHAVSVDERRCFFRQNLMEQKGKQDLQELWFPGVHCDVGGGYPEADGGLWRIPFQWILDEAQRAGLLVDQQRLDHVLQKTQVPAKPWLEPKHESLKGRWWLAEFIPKVPWRRRSGCRCFELGGGHPRHIPDKALIHRSVLLRIQEDKSYVPPNFPSDFLDKIRTLTDVPDSLPFEGEK
jgi:uncharacterized protein (DUF2235 family)